MEAKMKELILLVKELTEAKKLKWTFVGNTANVLQAAVGHFSVRITYSGANVTFQLIDNNKAIAAHGVSRNNDAEFNLFALWQNAYRQTLGVDEKLDSVLEELKKLKP